MRLYMQKTVQMEKPANTPTPIVITESEGINTVEYNKKEGTGFNPTYKFAIKSAKGKGENFPSKTERKKYPPKDKRYLIKIFKLKAFLIFYYLRNSMVILSVVRYVTALII